MNWIQTGLDATALGAQYALYALGIAVIFGIMNLINFAQGEYIMAAQYGLFVLAGLSFGLPLVLVIVGSVCVAVALALMTERIAFRPIRNANPATLLITSFAVSYLLQNVATLIFTALPQTFNIGSGLNTTIEFHGIHVVKLNFLTIGLVAVLMLGLGGFLRWTALGAEMRAAAEDFEMARILGVRANRVIAVAFGISGLLAATAAFLLAVQTGYVSPTTGLTPVLYAFIATILGGVGSLLGPVIAGFFLGSLTVILQVTLPDNLLPFRDALVFGGVFLVLVIRPEGLVVARSRMVRV
jgi:branched-chain amino acid transport system permease protein